MQIFRKTYVAFFFIFLISSSFFIYFSRSTFLSDPAVWPDEAIFFDTSSNIANNGSMATNLFKDAIPGLQIRALWYPPLYFYASSSWMSTFGQSIESSRTFSFLLSIASLGVFFCIVKMLFKNWGYAYFGTILLMFDSAFDTASKVARMDMLLFFFLLLGIWGYLLARRYKKLIFFFLTGIVLALGILTHPLGFIAPFLILMFMIMEKERIKKKISSLASIMIPICLGLLIWYVNIAHYVSFFLLQYKLQLARKATEIPYALTLFQKDFSWWLLFVAYIIIAVSLTYFSFKYRNWLSWFCLTGFFISFIALMWGKEIWYLLYFQPFITLSILTLLKIVKSQKNDLLFMAVIGLSFVILIINFNFLFNKLSLSKKTNYTKFADTVSNAIPNGSTVFLSTIPDPYFSLIKRRSITLLEFPTVPISDKSYEKLLNTSDYVIFNFLSDKRLTDYLRKNIEKTIEVGQGSGYTTYVLKLRSRKN